MKSGSNTIGWVSSMGGGRKLLSFESNVGKVTDVSASLATFHGQFFLAALASAHVPLPRDSPRRQHDDVHRSGDGADAGSDARARNSRARYSRAEASSDDARAGFPETGDSRVHSRENAGRAAASSTEARDSSSGSAEDDSGAAETHAGHACTDAAEAGG
jgi:hypothetical protein